MRGFCWHGFRHNPRATHSATARVGITKRKRVDGEGRLHSMAMGVKCEVLVVSVRVVCRVGL